MTQLSAQVREILGQQGPFINAINNFQVRTAQQDMAADIAAAISDEENIIIEAGTGIGKTFAYLVPAILSKQKVIISTGTKNLQDQLFNKDLPIAQKALKTPIKVALLKGRNNYLCLQRLNLYFSEGLFTSKETIHELQQIKSWSTYSTVGDIAELPFISENSPVWPYVTSNADNCLGQQCEFYSKCFLMRARKLAQEADLLVINHHLFFADIAIRDKGFGELLPGANAIVFDEAHQLNEIAALFLSESITSKQIIYLAKDIQAEQQRLIPDCADISKIALKLQKEITDMQTEFGQSEQKNAWSVIQHKPSLQNVIKQIKQIFNELSQALDVMKTRDKSIENCHRRVVEMLQKFTRLTADTHDKNYVHWYQTYFKSFAINLTPMVIADHVQRMMKEQKRSWIFTSATITIANDFSHFVTDLGLENTATKQHTSPFDYQQQALLYIPTNLPDPSNVQYTTKIVNAALPIIQKLQGRTFFLFTSYRALNEAAQLLRQQLSLPILIQGSMSKPKLLEQFCQLGNAVLLGTSSFWEGVDVRGRTLSCVIIDKLPFFSPEDPINKARIQSYKQRGIEPFLAYQLPQAITFLKQGSGRLIRDTQDKGILMLCDPRLYTRHYGKLFLDSLPNMKRTRELATVETFCDAINNSH